jgi:hypothetical protein
MDRISSECKDPEILGLNKQYKIGNKIAESENVWENESSSSKPNQTESSMKGIQVVYDNVDRKTLETIINKVDNNGEVQAITDQQDVSEGLTCVKQDIIIDQNLQGKASSLNATTNIDMEETGSVSNTHEDASKEDGMNADSRARKHQFLHNQTRLWRIN